MIAYLNGDEKVARKIELIPELLLPAIVVGEMAYGARKSDRSNENILAIREFASACKVLNCGEETGHEYGRIKILLKEKGEMIPENDVWIAAYATLARLPLLSRDVHFDRVDELVRISW